jgi:hypothetical protein
MKKQHLSYARQARASARSAAKLVLYLIGGAVAAAFVWGTGWQFKVLLALAGFFVLVLLLEVLAARRHERAPTAASPSHDPSIEEKAPLTDHAFRPDGDWHKRVIVVDGRPVSVRIGAAAGLLEKAGPFASALCSDPDSLGSRFREFKSAEAARNRRWAAEVKGLEIESIDFVSSRRPDSAEISFTIASGGEAWTCLLMNGEFQDLLMDT